MHCTPTPTRAFSMVGLLVTMVCIAVLASILLTSLNKAVTGQGSQQAGTVRSTQDELYLYSMYQSLTVFGNDHKGSYPVPSEIAGGAKTEENTTANFFSVMVMQNLIPTRQLISGNEYSGFVEEMTHYDFSAHNPAAGVFWDSNFKADLQRMSNVSFAHQPLIGKRFTNNWNTRMTSRVPVLGNRGPMNGVSSRELYSCGRDGVWGGNILFADGHIAFTKDPQDFGLTYEEAGQRMSDNIFKMETGNFGADAILSFTKAINKNGVQLQWD